MRKRHDGNVFLKRDWLVREARRLVDKKCLPLHRGHPFMEDHEERHYCFAVTPDSEICEYVYISTIPYDAWSVGSFSQTDQLNPTVRGIQTS